MEGILLVFIGDEGGGKSKRGKSNGSREILGELWCAEYHNGAKLVFCY